MLWVGCSKLQPPGELGAGVLIKNQQDSRFILPEDIMYLLPPPVFPSLLGLYFPAGRSLVAQMVRQSPISSCCAAACCHLSWASSAKAPWWPPAFFSMPIICLHAIVWSYGTSSSSRIFPSAKIFTAFFSGSLLLLKTTSFMELLFSITLSSF